MDRLILALLAFALAWGVFAFGAVYQWAHRPLLVIAAVTGALAWMRSRRRGGASGLMAAAAVTAVAIALQLIPLDHLTLERYFPGTHKILLDTNLGYAWAAAAGTPFAHPASISPHRTWIGLSFFVAAVVFTIGVSRWLTRDRIRHLAVIIGVIGGVLALAGIVQRTVSGGLIYGFWQSDDPGNPFGPFVNKNHFAGWMLMALPVTLGLAAGLIVRRRERPVRDWRDRILQLGQPETAGAAMVLFAAFTMMMALLFTLSRSAIATAPLSIALALLMTTGTARGWAWRSSVIVGSLGVAAAVWAGVELLAARFAELDAVGFNARAGMWRDAWRMAQDVPLTGVGIRAYTEASLLYQTVLPQYHVGAAHNDWLQLLAEGGLLVGVPALLLLAAVVAETARCFRDHRDALEFGATYWIRLGAATGILAISLQSLVEFSLQMPGNTIMFSTICAIAIAPVRASALNARTGR